MNHHGRKYFPEGEHWFGISLQNWIRECTIENMTVYLIYVSSYPERKPIAALWTKLKEILPVKSDHDISCQEIV